MSAKQDTPDGGQELAKALTVSRKLIVSVAVFSAFANLLMLTGPLFMLQVYDRVLASRSVETLTALLLLVTVLFLIYGLLEFARGRLMARVGARAQTLLSRRADEISLRSAQQGEHVNAEAAPRDLATLRRALSSGAPLVLFDMPWTPIFLAAMFIFHPWLGLLGLAGGVLMIAITALNQIRSRAALQAAHDLEAHAESLADGSRREAGPITALGMKDSVLDRLAAARQEALAAGVVASDRSGAYAAASKSLRFYLQSAILALGAALAIAGEITPGVMIAASILMGRALAPVEQGIGQWPMIQRGLAAWRRLQTTLSEKPDETAKPALPSPESHLSVRNLSVAPPETGALSIIGLAFDVAPGEALGVVGHSASGKSSLARALANIWQPTTGTVRLAGATLDQWCSDTLGGYLGYLPQDVSLMPGTVAENIARMKQPVDAAAVIEAAKAAGAHEMILRLPQGYATPVGEGGQALSGGQRQRIELARALYGDPALVILDEPDAHLDSDGETALLDAIDGLKQRNKAIVIMAHRPSAISACDKLLVLESGRQRAYGPRDEMLREYAKARTRVVANETPRLAIQGS